MSELLILFSPSILCLMVTAFVEMFVSKMVNVLAPAGLKYESPVLIKTKQNKTKQDGGWHNFPQAAEGAFIVLSLPHYKLVQVQLLFCR